MIRKRYGYWIVCWLLSLVPAYAQTTTYPLQVNANVVPPYSLYLSDYYSGTRDRLSITLINRDQLTPTVSVRLRMTITAAGGIRIQTNENAFIQPIAVEAGAPVRLTQEDLAPYFQPDNIITQGFLSAGKMPEGMVEFCFQAIEAYTGRVLSTSTCTRAWITSQKPPLLSLPRNDESIAFREPLNVLFQWTPLHQGLAQVEYDFILKELWDNGMTPQAAFPYSPEIYRETTRSTSIVYGALQPPLLPGKRYAWCVQAKARDGMEELNVFQNNGYSEIRWFKLQDNCQPLELVEATAERKRVTLAWTPLPEHIGFTINYREKSTSEQQNEWKESSTQQSQSTLYGLKAGAIYEYRVGSICMSGQPIYTAIMEVLVPAADSARTAQCGLMPAVNLQNQELIGELKPQEVFQVGDFPVTVVRCSGGKGSLTGVGWTIIPWLNDAKMAVEFNNISVNTDRQVTQGVVRAIYDEKAGQIANLDDAFVGGFDQGLVKTGLTKTDTTFDFSIPGVESFALGDDGSLIITDADGEPHSIAMSDREGEGNEGNKVNVFPMTVKDKDGNVYQVEKVTETENGKEKETVKATKLGNIGTPLAADSFDPTQLNADKAVVRFTKGTGKYSFDTWQSYYANILLIRDKYEKLHNNYYAAWKLLPSGENDDVGATIEIVDKAIDPTKVIFTTPQGTRYDAAHNNGKYTLRVTAGPEGDVQELYALYPKGDGKYYTLGKLGIATYAKQVREVVLVSVENTHVDYDKVEQMLKSVYDSVGIHWTISRDAFAYDATGLMADATGLSTYNDAMRALNNAYRVARPGFKPSANYVFFLKATGNTDINKRDLTGFMPRGAQFGYIFTSEVANADEPITVAHELGHGRWKLYHPFDKTYGSFEAAKKTNNLMAYGNGGHIAKWQWDQLADPAAVVSVFERDERSEMIAKDFKEYLFEILNQYWCALDENRNAFNYYCFDHGNIRGLMPVSQLGEFDLVRSVVVKYATPGVYDFNTSYALKTLTGRGYNYYITFQGTSGTQIDIYFVSEVDRTKFVSGVLTKPNVGWKFHYSTLNSQLELAIKEKKYEDIPRLLLTLPQCGYEAITATTRVEVIKSLITETWTDDIEEVLILKLVNEIKDDKITVTTFIDELKKINWMELFGSIQGEESDALGDMLLIAAEKYYKYQSPNNIGYVSYESLSALNFYSRYTFTQQNGKIKTAINTDVSGNHYEDILVPYSDPFDVFVLGKEKEDLTKAALPTAPYILLLKKIKKDEAQRMLDQGMVIIDIASLFTGIGELRLAMKTPGALARFSRLVLGSADMVSTATSIYCSGNANDELCLQWKKYELYVQLGLISTSAWDLFKGTFNRSDELVSYLNKYAEYSHVSQIKNKKFIAELDKLKLDEKTLQHLDGDLNPSLIDAFKANPELIDAWEVLDDVHPASRAEVADLKKMSRDIGTEPRFEAWIKGHPEMYDGWRHWEDTYRSLGDPVADLLGPGRLSHADEWNAMIKEVKDAGGEIIYRKGGIAYGAGLRQGEPGQLIIDPDASITALRHEHRHFVDDRAAGFPGFAGMFDVNFRLKTEYNAYKLEIVEMRKIGQEGIVAQLKKNFLSEVGDIRMKNPEIPDESVLKLIEELKNF